MFAPPSEVALKGGPSNQFEPQDETHIYSGDVYVDIFISFDKKS